MAFSEDPLRRTCNSGPDTTFWSRISRQLVCGIYAVWILWILDSLAKAYLCLRQRSLSQRVISAWEGHISAWERDICLRETHFCLRETNLCLISLYINMYLCIRSNFWSKTSAKCSGATAVAERAQILEAPALSLEQKRCVQLHHLHEYILPIIGL